jgi:hypothetical protein
MSRKAARTLEIVGRDLQRALRTESKNLLHIGDLLNEAKEMLEHGEWLPWLKVNFGGGHATASNYMNAAKFAARHPVVSDLKLRPAALYALAQHMDEPMGLYDGDALEAIFKEAETEWVGHERAREIALVLRQGKEEERLRQEKELKGDKPEPGPEEEEDDIEDILDGPPPELPPTEEDKSDVDLDAFDQAVATLARLRTKPVSTFVQTEHKRSLLHDVALFLGHVEDAIKKEGM